ncbi:MAG: glycosyltransferase family 4 protein [Methylobacter sp.]
MQKILVIGQTPPPYGGQAMMIKRMLDGVYANANLYHVRMAFSKDMDEMGKFGFAKLFHPFSIIARTIYLKLKYNIQILYYPPSGPSMLPMLRDVALLLCVRWIFKRTIFHFHAAGLSELYPKLPWYTRFLFRLAYFNPDIAIQLSSHNPDDAAILQAKSKFIIPNGIEDEYLGMDCPKMPQNEVCNILFVGMISESKGVLILLEAIKILKDSGLHVKVNVVGKFASESFKQIVFGRISDSQMEDFFEFTGVLTGQAKHEQYLAADIFCFPTFFECESFGLVAVEAMQFSVPVILSRWRGVQSLISDGVEGFLVSDRDSVALANKLALLVANPDLRKRMGIKGRERYLQQYTTEMFYQKMDECFKNL